ncbi:hypothetical protein UA08_07810 [Talaromyces atroroseus]|uniref:Uncharacterized protein n=1 Tax=Talaromyces atroroseus TaxID=1441469 RepID=A0A225A9P1_TALAT|nr:hypothetical protein UA08_07810 [Talaromyces atroroseus]OKL56780.1 hypothetical protein UA08_07810 [Talaromyces atroroseus]
MFSALDRKTAKYIRERLFSLTGLLRLFQTTVIEITQDWLGPGNLVIFVLFGIAFAFCLKFPDIWTQWWSEDDGPSSQDVGYWLGLYAMLQTLPLIMLCIWLGSDSISYNPRPYNTASTDGRAL